MKRWMYLLPGLFGLIGACSGTDQNKPDDKTGALTLQLVARDSQGETYRLRSAVFQVYGYPNQEFPTSGEGGASGSGYYYQANLSSESDPNAALITHRVTPGYYYVTFDTTQPWYIEHVTGAGAERVAQSVLLSPVTQYTYVYDHGVSQIFYQFGVDGRPIDFRYGDIDIGIGIEHPGEGDGVGGFGGFGGAAGASSI